MKKKFTTLFLYSIGTLILISAVIFITEGGDGSGTIQKESSSGVLVAIDNQFDFNTVRMDDGNVLHQYEVLNNSTESVIIEKVYTSCGCTTASIVDGTGKTYGIFGMPGHGASPKTNIVVEPGESVTVEAIFDPAAHGPSGVGLAQRSVYLETNSTQSRKLEFSFQAMVIR